jgi:S-formylglutathione hydrolase FrmB
VEHFYGAGPRRVIAGLSMGGFGALSYAARHPGMFRAAASYSGVVDTLYEPGGPQNIERIDVGEGLPADGPWGDPVRQGAVWAAHNPTSLAPLLRGIPVFLSCGNGQPGVFDPPGTQVNAFEVLFHAENLALARRLRGDPKLTTDFYGNGTHSWPYWQRELHRSLPILLRALRR